MGHLTAARGAFGRATAPLAGARPPEDRNGVYTVAPVAAALIRCGIAGFWTMPVLAGFIRDAEAAVRALDCPPGEHMVLCDVTHAAIQSQPVFAAFVAMPVAAKDRPRRVALVSNSALSRMQARRLIAARPDIALFDDEHEALRWLTTVA